MRRVEYLENVGFLASEDDHWRLGTEGETYYPDYDRDMLTEIMCRRNLGLRSLLYALLAGPMSIEEVGEQQLRAHAELGWNPENTDMAKQRTNWLRSLGLVDKEGQKFALTDDGRTFVEDALRKWTQEPPRAANQLGAFSASTYETTAVSRSIDPEFRATVIGEYDRQCPISGVDHRGLLDVAHVLSWSEYPDYRVDLGNVLPLSKTHHAAFDRQLFTIDEDYRLRVDPGFKTESRLLRQTILDKAGDQVEPLQNNIRTEYLKRHNESVDWLAD
ncbi:HNH endonuclease [Halapricum sp. CBA1109]|uniref:HNH endonuclease n=1 Tax=Halapricum sp. CBA1109 TaxID=2668068 RepID=UPI001E2851E9|nr:HNH endonuclease [Halapricum sp. CBA1109]